MRLIQYLLSFDSCRRIVPRQHSNRGFSVAELLVATGVGLLLVSLCLASVKLNSDVLGSDTARTRLNENLRGAMDVLIADGRVAGQNLSSTFPAVEIANGTGTASDQLTLRRNLLDEVLKVCTALTAGSTVRDVYFAIPGTTQGCVYSGLAQNYNSWRTYRTTHGGVVKAFIYDSTVKLGEFFDYSSETDTGTSYYIHRSSGTWARNYPNTSSSVYILEEWTYRKDGDILQIVQNRDTTNPYNLSFGITDFQAIAYMQDGTTNTSFTTTNSWSLISRIEVTLSGTDKYAKKSVNRTLVSQFFPRNVLSN